MTWIPHVTVATIIENNGRFLMVEEKNVGQRVFNQPAGHLEAGESLLAAAHRETLEETQWQVNLTGFLGIYHYQTPTGTTYIRHCFTGVPAKHCPDSPLDPDINGVHWMSADEILSKQFPARSISVQKVLEDYLDKKPVPLDLIFYHEE